MSRSRRFWVTGAIAIVLAMAVPTVRPAAQSGHPIADAPGSRPNRALFGELPFESIDTLTGNVRLTFTDLALPGNGGLDLVIQRTYNMKSNGWFMGVAGMPYKVSPVNAPSAPSSFYPEPHEGEVPKSYAANFPKLFTVDGTVHKTDVDQPPSWFTAPTQFKTDGFWKYDATLRRLQLPNGLEGLYDAQGDLREITDAFGNRITMSWVNGGLETVVQHPGGQTRTVTFGPDPESGKPTMNFEGRKWTYDENGGGSMRPPEGPGSRTEYADGLHLSAYVTPAGGRVEYDYEHRPWRDPRDNLSFLSWVVTERRLSGHAITPATWRFTYSDVMGDEHVVAHVVENDPNPLKHVFRYGVMTIGENIVLLDHDTFEGDTRLEHVTTGYESRIVTGFAGLPNDFLTEVVTTRGSQTWRTAHTYAATNYGDFGQPEKTEETGTAGYRLTERQFRHNFTRYILGRVTREKVSQGVDTESFESSATFHDDTGFRLSQTTLGIKTEFDPTSQGNIGVERHFHDNDIKHETSFGYDWGAVATIATPMYAITREINPSGTVKKETRRDLTMEFTYDGLDRVREAKPDGPHHTVGAKTTTEYDNGQGRSFTVRRGTSWIRTDLDGFGRTIGAENAAGIKTAIEYDALGRKRFESYPYRSTPTPGDRFTYDGLGRLTMIRHPDVAQPDDSTITISYDGLTQTITDENGHETVQAWQAFGDPSEARLRSVRDANQQTWTYGYNVVGSLTDVDAPGDHGSRSWRYYAGRNLLETETHPESGTTRYTYDSGGRLWQRFDAKNQRFQHYYDNNDRLTWIETPDNRHDLRFSYDAADNRDTMSSQLDGAVAVSTTFTYDDANRLTSRRDTIGSRSFTVGYGYDDRDNLVRTTYPSGRAILQRVDAANRIEAVSEENGPTYARGATAEDPMRYYPNGILAGYTAGNGLAFTATLTDDQRQRLKDVDMGSMGLTYTYDKGGNVREINDRSDRNRDSTFGYDALDRLESVTGFGATSYTYDALGNRETKPGVTYVYDRPTQRLTHDGTAPTAMTTTATPRRSAARYTHIRRST